MRDVDQCSRGGNAQAGHAERTRALRPQNVPRLTALVLLILCGLFPDRTMAQSVGQQAVGFTRRVILRNGRSGERSIRVAVWFPRASNSGVPVTIADLWEAAGREDPDTLGSLAARLGLAMIGDSTASQQKITALVSSSTNAFHGGPPAGSDLPVIVWGARHFTQIAQYEMSEMLAREGFVVLSVWSNDPPRAMLWDQASDDEKQRTITEHARDVAYALRDVPNYLPADTTSVTGVAWSYGGQSLVQPGVLPSLRGVIALDANVVGPFPVRRLAGDPPVLWLVGKDTARRGLDRLSELSLNTAAVQLPGLAHGNFNALEGYLPGLAESAVVHPWSSGGEQAVAAYRALVRVVTAAALYWNTASPPEGAALLRIVSNSAAPLSATALPLPATDRARRK